MKNTDKLKGKGDLLYLDDDFGISFEDVNGMAMCHCEVNNWSPTIRTRCKAKIDQLQREHKRDAFGVAVKGDGKHINFLTKMGFKHYLNKWTLDEAGNDLILSIYWREYCA